MVKLPSTGTSRLSSTDIARQFARLLVVYGASRAPGNAEQVILIREWLLALGWYSAQRLEGAINEWVKVGKFWPTPAEILEILHADAPPAQRPQIVDTSRTEFCRDGRTEAEEIAHRAAQCRRWRAQAAAQFPPAPVEEQPQPKPASQDGLTPEFIAHAKARGYYRGEAAE